MNPSISEYSSDAEKFSAILNAADADWDAVSPCVEWTAAEVVDHVVDTQRTSWTSAEGTLVLGPQAPLRRRGRAISTP